MENDNLIEDNLIEEDVRRHTVDQELARLESPVMRAAHLDQAWRAEAVCAEERYEGVRENWFAPDNTFAAVGAADICFTCPVRQSCLEWACESKQQHGIWGGIPTSVRRAKIAGLGIVKAHDFDILIDMPNVYDTIDTRSRFFFSNLKEWDGIDDEDSV